MFIVLVLSEQLTLEQRAGRVFEGWHENPICFPPTYKFIINSDEYFGKDAPIRTKRRTPAW
jgi:phosphatidylinositol-bisphosphatase